MVNTLSEIPDLEATLTLQTMVDLLSPVSQHLPDSIKIINFSSKLLSSENVEFIPVWFHLLLFISSKFCLSSGDFTMTTKSGRWFLIRSIEWSITDGHLGGI